MEPAPGSMLPFARGQNNHGRLNNAPPHTHTPQDVHVLTPGTCEYVAVQVKEVLQMDEVKGLEMVRLFCIILRAQCEHKGSCERQPGGSEVGVRRSGKRQWAKECQQPPEAEACRSNPLPELAKEPALHLDGKPRETDCKPRRTVINLLL